MTTFKTLDAAFNYRTHCPLCQEPIVKGYSSITEYDGEKTVEFDLGNTKVTIEYYGGKILEWREGSSFTEIITTGTPVYASNGSAQSLSRSGKEVFRVICCCGKCSCYAYILQVHMDMDEKRVVGVVLNSETLSFERGPLLHEIKNIYTTEKTEYTTFTNYESEDAKPHDKQTTVLPLIPMDLENPDKTLNRIKTLVLFS